MINGGQSNISILSCCTITYSKKNWTFPPKVKSSIKKKIKKSQNKQEINVHSIWKRALFKTLLTHMRKVGNATVKGLIYNSEGICWDMK